MGDMNQPMAAKPVNTAPQGKKIKTNYLIPLVVVFFAIAAFLSVMYLGLL